MTRTDEFILKQAKILIKQLEAWSVTKQWPIDTGVKGFVLGTGPSFRKDLIKHFTPPEPTLLNLIDALQRCNRSGCGSQSCLDFDICKYTNIIDMDQGQRDNLIKILKTGVPNEK